MKSVLRFVLVLLCFGGAAQAIAEDALMPPSYSDDRSDAGALVRSFYNAINRQEYVRAWSYFGAPPAKDFETFAKGYGDTAHVDVFTGRVISEGAAGSTYSQVPVAIRATDAKGEAKVFAGCYTVRAINPQIQEPPFRALLIDKASLKPKDETILATAAPEWCGDQEPAKETADEALSRVTAMFAERQREACNSLQDPTAEGGGGKPEVYELRFRRSYEEATAPEHLYHLYEFACASYAYNFSSVYYLGTDDGEITQLSFAEPRLTIKYLDEENAKLKSMVVGGFTAADSLINASFDPATGNLTSFNKWRGIGDASSAGTWHFQEGDFILTGYEADPTYDGESTAIPVIVNGRVKN